MPADPDTVPNWLRLDARVTTSGQPGEAELAAIAALGVRGVINLGLHAHPRALPDERASVEALGMGYAHIPVPFEAPSEADFAAFCRAYEAWADRPVHVHCIANDRVSAFLFRYRRDVLGMAEAAARPALDRIWAPDPVWAAFLARRG